MKEYDNVEIVVDGDTMHIFKTTPDNKIKALSVDRKESWKMLKEINRFISEGGTEGS